MPVTPHRFLSLGRLTLLAGKAWQDQDGTHYGSVQGVPPKNHEGKGVVNSKLLLVTGSIVNQDNEDRCSYY
jgi:hypothetical protein